MAERTIVRGVRVGATTYVPGMEEKLSSVLTQEETDRLTEKGYLEGKWTGKAKEEKAPTTAKEK